MSRKAQPLTRPSVSALRAHLPEPARRLLDATAEAARDLDVELWAVGGVVRDLALRRPAADLDLATNGEPRLLAATAAERLGAGAAIVTAESAFGTASVEAEGVHLDLARLRNEDYVALGALPRVSFVREVEQDLGRRDFSVNAMALALAGPRRDEFVDPWGGFGDLGARRLRVLHDRSFIDDATRLWRGARTAARFDLAPDAETARLIEEGARWLGPISGERLWAELALTAGRGRGGRTLALLDDWGVLAGTHPALHLHEETRAALQRRVHPLPPVLLAALLIAPLPAPSRRAVLERLAATKVVRETVEDTARLLAGDDTTVSPEALEALEHTGKVARLAARWLHPTSQPTLQRAIGRWSRTRPSLDVAALLRLGVPRGPALGQTLRGLRRARYLGTLGDAAAARREVRRRLDSGTDWLP